MAPHSDPSSVYNGANGGVGGSPYQGPYLEPDIEEEIPTEGEPAPSFFTPEGFSPYSLGQTPLAQGMPQGGFAGFWTQPTDQLGNFLEQLRRSQIQQYVSGRRGRGLGGY